jgi:excisionase family DNA binding protein
VTFEVTLGPELVEQLVAAAAERVLTELPDPASEFVSPKTAARLLDCDQQRIYDLISAGRLSRLKVGGRTLLRRREVLALVVVDRERSR